MKVACAHTNSKPLAVYENILHIKRALDIFKEEKVEYALFPELCVSGYLNSKHMLNNYIRVAQEVEAKLAEISAQYPFLFAVGMPVEQNNQWYIAQAVYYKGEVAGKHCKTHLSDTEATTFAYGNNLDLTKLSGGHTGFQICLESHIPEITSMYQQKGAEILSVPFASPREKPQEKWERLSKMLQTRAYDNTMFVMACNSTGQTPSGKPYAGFSGIISPRGQVLALEMGYEQGFCIAHIDLTEIQTIKQSKMGYFTRFKRQRWLQQHWNNTLS